MPSNVNVYTSGFEATGTNVSVPQYRFTLTVNWTDNTGAPRTHTETVLFPNILNQIPAGKRDDLVQELMLAMLRIKAGAD